MKILAVLLFALTTSNCTDDPANVQICHEGVIIGKIRSGGGGLAVSVADPTLSTHEWNGFNNVVEALNIPENFRKPGLKIYFFSRWPTETERVFWITADGSESAKPLIFVTSISSMKCPVPGQPSF